jgi:hypothetical protein
MPAPFATEQTVIPEYPFSLICFFVSAFIFSINPSIFFGIFLSSARLMGCPVSSTRQPFWYIKID